MKTEAKFAEKVVIFALVFVSCFHSVTAVFTTSAYCTTGLNCDLNCNSNVKSLRNALTTDGTTLKYFSNIPDNFWTYSVVIPLCGADPQSTLATTYPNFTFSDAWQLSVPGRLTEKYPLGKYDSSSWQLGSLDGSVAYKVSFTGGDYCMGIMDRRSTTVYLKCNPSYTMNNALVTPSEPSMCKYQIVIQLYEVCPSYVPQPFPTALPTVQPTRTPTNKPTTLTPTVQPTTIKPTYRPTTIKPTLYPTWKPQSSRPSIKGATLVPSVASGQQIGVQLVINHIEGSQYQTTQAASQDVIKFAIVQLHSGLMSTTTITSSSFSGWNFSITIEHSHQRYHTTAQQTQRELLTVSTLTVTYVVTTYLTADVLTNLYSGQLASGQFTNTLQAVAIQFNVPCLFNAQVQSFTIAPDSTTENNTKQPTLSQTVLIYIIIACCIVPLAFVIYYLLHLRRRNTASNSTTTNSSCSVIKLHTDYELDHEEQQCYIPATITSTNYSNIDPSRGDVELTQGGGYMNIDPSHGDVVLDHGEVHIDEISVAIPTTQDSQVALYRDS